MTNLNPDQIYRRTQDSLNSLATRLTDLIGSSQIDSTIQREIELFGLYDEVQDGNLSEQDLNPVIEVINTLDLQEMAERGYLKYNRGQNKFSLHMGRIQSDIARGIGTTPLKDFNGDGDINVRDVQALQFIINHKENIEVSLEEQLAGLDDPDTLVRKELEQVAQRRGLRTTPARYDAFITKFYDQYLKTDNLSRNEVTRMIELHDIFEKEDANFDLNKLDYYADKLKEKELPSKYLRSFAVYEADSGFSAEHREGMEELVGKIIEAQEERDGRTLRTIDQILRSKRIPLTGDEFSMQNINSFLEDLDDPIKYPKMIMDSWADKSIKPEDTEIKAAFSEQINTYYQSYLETYEGDTHRALASVSKIKDLYVNSYKKLKSELKKIERNRYIDAAGNLDPAAKQADIENSVASFAERVDKLNLYSELFVNLRSRDNPEGHSLRNINIVFSYDNFRDFDLTGSAREEKLTEYLDILEGGQGASKAEFLGYIFKSRTLPFNPEGTPITSSNIDSLLDTLDDERGFFEFRLQDMASKSDLQNYPTPETNVHAEFVAKFMDYKFDDELSNGQIIQAKYLFDNLKSKYPGGFNLDELDFYVDALVNPEADLAFSTIIKFINKLQFLPMADKERYMNILLTPGESEEKRTILQYLNY